MTTYKHYLLKLIVVIALGCHGKTYTLDIRRAERTYESAPTGRIVSTVDRIAIANGFFRVATAQDTPAQLVAYRKDVSTLAGDPASIHILLSEPDTDRLLINVITGSGIDDPDARSFRAQVKTALEELMPKARFSGF